MPDTKQPGFYESVEYILSGDRLGKFLRQKIAVMLADLREQGGKIVACTPAFAQTYGYTVNELVGKSLDILLQDQHKETHQATLKQYIKSPTSRIMGDRRIPGKCKDGSIVTKTLWIRDTDEEGIAAVEVFD